MPVVAEDPGGRVALLFTRFPVQSETFLLREVDVLRALGVNLEVLALWPVPERLRAAGPAPDHVFRPLHLVFLVYWLPYWLIRRPRALWQIAAALIAWRPGNALNLMENLLGIGYALVQAHALRHRFDHFHGVWASAPGTAAWALSLLTDRPGSLAGHAYDLFEDGGDGLLPAKILWARFLRTSTEAGRERWIRLGAPASRIRIIRRGLARLPVCADRPAPRPPYRLLAVGRLVEKMGHDRVLELLAALDCPFEAEIVGDGPLGPSLCEQARQLGLSGRVTFSGQLAFSEVEARYAAADALLFGGGVARSGDRAGFPNAIGEAMAWGVPVCARPVGAVTEGIRHGETGLLFDDPRDGAQSLKALLESPESYAAVRRAARDWAENHYDAHRNLAPLARLLRSRPRLT